MLEGKQGLLRSQVPSVSCRHAPAVLPALDPCLLPGPRPKPPLKITRSEAFPGSGTHTASPAPVALIQTDTRLSCPFPLPSSGEHHRQGQGIHVRAPARDRAQQPEAPTSICHVSDGGRVSSSPGRDGPGLGLASVALAPGHLSFMRTNEFARSFCQPRLSCWLLGTPMTKRHIRDTNLQVEGWGQSQALC